MENQTSELREKIRQHFNQISYPNNPIEVSPKNDLNLLYVYNLITPLYMRNQRIIDTNFYRT